MLGSKGNITQDASEPVTHLENRNPPNVCLMKMAGAALGSSRWILPAVAQSANSALLPLCHCFPTAAGVDQRAIHYPKIYKGVFALKDYVLLKNKGMDFSQADYITPFLSRGHCTFSFSSV